MFTPEEMQQQAQRLKAALDERALPVRDGRYALAACQELVARALGAAHWHEAHKNAQRASARTLTAPSVSNDRARTFRPGVAQGPRLNRERWSRWPAQPLLGHTLLLGTAGSGRTSALKTLALTAQDTVRGLIWVHAGPDTSVKPFLDAHRIGRLSTVQHLNFVRVSNDGEHRFNPAGWMQAGDLVAWLEAWGQGRLPCPDGWSLAGWHDRAVRVWEAVVPILVRRRDERGQALDLDTLLNAVTWDGIQGLWSASDLTDDERAGLRRYISPWFTSSEAPAFVAPVAPAWARAFGTLRTIGPYLDGPAPLPGQPTGGSLYQVIEQRETLVVSLPARWRSPDDPRALAYDAFLMALVQVLRTRGPGLRPIDPSRPLPWRTTLVFEDAPGMERFDPSLAAAARARGVALVLSYRHRNAVHDAGVADDLVYACRTLVQMAIGTADHAPQLPLPPGMDAHAWCAALMAQRPGEAWAQGPDTSGWIAFDPPERPTP